MPDLDRFETRLAGAVGAFADRARTRVDAAELARQVASEHPRRRAASLMAPLPVPAVAVLASALLLALFAWTLGGAPRQDGRPAVAPAALTPSPRASGDPLAPAHVTGTAGLTIVSAGSTSTVDEVDRVTGIVVTTTDATDDPRVSGTGTLRLDASGTGSLRYVTGTFRLENDAGAWEGPCSGASVDVLASGPVACWLTGSGAYDGLTYYRSARHAAFVAELTGVIAPLAAPAPPEVTP